MDSVPFAFCMDVMGNVSTSITEPSYSARKPHWSTVLAGRWNAAVRSYDENLKQVSLTLYCNSGEWGYSMQVHRAHEDWSFEDLLPLDRRYVRCVSITLDTEHYVSDFYAACSQEKFFTKLLPFFLQQSDSHLSLSVAVGISMQHIQMYFDAFLSCKVFRLRCSEICLPYYGPESVQFLATILEGDCNLQSLSLPSYWPHSEPLERLMLKFLGGKIYHCNIPDLWTGDGHVKLNSTILKAVFDAWYRMEKIDHERWLLRGSHFTAYVPWNYDLEQLLAIPVPPNVIRTQRKPKEKDSDESFILWTREDGSALACRAGRESVYFSNDLKGRLFEGCEEVDVKPLWS
uniref:FBA_2 domain-containing protein n=1 Tax=Steinernema glaseri TaxID=37863 RepID=A0A1I7ZP52_9BILA